MSISVKSLSAEQLGREVLEMFEDETGITGGSFHNKLRWLVSLAEEGQRLRAILDARPAVNAGLVEAYIKWSSGVYASNPDALGVKQ